MKKPADNPATPFKGFIDIPEREQFGARRPSLAAACYGKMREAEALNFFLVEAYKLAKKAPESCKNVTLQLSHNDILSVIRIAEGSLIKYLKEFNTWEYVLSLPYSQEYTVNVEKIRQAVANPPDPKTDPCKAEKEEKQPRKSRGKSCKNETCETLETSPINQDEVAEILAALREEVSNLKLEVANLQPGITNLQLRITNLQLAKSASSHSQPVLGPQVIAPRILEITRDSRELPYGCADAPFDDLDPFIEDLAFPLSSGSKRASYSRCDIEPVATGKAVPPCVTSQDSLFGGAVTRVTPLRPNQEEPAASQGKGTGKGKGKGKGSKGDVVLFPTGARVEEKTTGTRPTKKEAEVVLTDEERRIFDLYCQLWFITIPPKITEDRKLHCGKLAPHVNTLDDMKALEKIARRKLKALGIEKKLIELGNLVNAINDWKAEQMPTPEEEEESTPSQDRRPASTGSAPQQGQGIAVVSPEAAQKQKDARYQRLLEKLERARAEKRKVDPALLTWARNNNLDVTGIEAFTEDELFDLNTRKRAVNG